jgi:two-component sensor histidine kinase
LDIDEGTGMSLALDIHTIFFFIIAVSALGAVFLSLDAREDATIFDAAFIAGLVLQAVAWTLIYLRGSVSDLLSFYIGNSLQFLGVALIGLGLQSTRGRVPGTWVAVYAVTLALTFLFWWFPALDQKTHIILISWIYPIFFGVPGWLIARDSRGKSPIQSLIGFFLMLYAAGMFFRGVSLLAGGKYDLFSRGIIQILVILAFALVMNMVTLGYILMKKEKANDRLKEMSEAKNILLTELQHRIKNSLAIISSLTNLEAEFHGDAALGASMQKMRDRIRAVAGLYNMLIAKAPSGGVYIDAYVGDLVEYLRAGYSSESRQVAIVVEVQHVLVDAKTSISIGLIINELVTNAIKYAFPEGRFGTVRVRYSRDSGEDTLMIQDDGIGMKVEPGGLGTLVVSTLAKQLGGDVEYAREGGTRVEIRFAGPTPRGSARPSPVP